MIKNYFLTLKTENPDLDFFNLKSAINTMGNIASQDKELESAVAIFKINAAVYPNWWISFVGIAESYDSLNDTPNALINYKKAILLNKNNDFNYNDAMRKRIEALKNN